MPSRPTSVSTAEAAATWVSRWAMALTWQTCDFFWGQFVRLPNIASSFKDPDYASQCYCWSLTLVVHTQARAWQLMSMQALLLCMPFTNTSSLCIAERRYHQDVCFTLSCVCVMRVALLACLHILAWSASLFQKNHSLHDHKKKRKSISTSVD